VTQGGGVYVHASARNLRITNDLVIGNSGTYGGGIRVGTPYVGGNNNSGIRISYNRIRDNGGTNLAGGVGLFAGTTQYLVDHNDMCGNFSAEYGGALTSFGLNNGSISSNRVWLNESYDEGGGIMVAGELPANANQPSPGSGPVTINANEIVVNNANDDGGGIRLLQVNDARMDIYNNIIADNMSTHEGGGIALDDASNVRFINNTVARNITTATAVTSDGSPAPAGLSSGRNSIQLMGLIGPNRSPFSDPVLRNNVFWENKAGTWDGTKLTGISLDGDSTPANIWDMGVADGSGTLSPTYSIMTALTPGQPTQVQPAGNTGMIPGTNVPLSTTKLAAPFVGLESGNGGIKFVNPYSVGVSVSTLRTFPGFRQSVIIARNAAPDAQGNYHVGPGSSATGLFAIARTPVQYGPPQLAVPQNVDAPTTDIDGSNPFIRYTPPATSSKRFDAGADELP
jgi:hypothetical protein